MRSTGISGRRRRVKLSSAVSITGLAAAKSARNTTPIASGITQSRQPPFALTAGVARRRATRRHRQRSRKMRQTGLKTKAINARAMRPGRPGRRSAATNAARAIRQPVTRKERGETASSSGKTASAIRPAATASRLGAAPRFSQSAPRPVAAKESARPKPGAAPQIQCCARSAREAAIAAVSPSRVSPRGAVKSVNAMNAPSGMVRAARRSGGQGGG